MPVEPPWANQNSSYGAEQTRRAVFSPYLRNAGAIGTVLGGAIGTADCLIKTVSLMTVKVEPGELIIPGTELGAGQSGYYGRVTSAENVTLAASSGSANRIDRISAIVTDKAYSGNPDKLAIAAQTGTPNAGATLATAETYAPAAPANSFTIGYVLVEKGASSINAGNIAGVPNRAVLGVPTLRIVGQGTASPVTLTYGEFATFETATEVKLPAPANGAECGFLRYSGTGTVLVKCVTGANIWWGGKVVAGSTGAPLGINMAQRFMADGSNWFLIGDGGAVSPTSISAYTARTELTNLKATEEKTFTSPSATRPVIAVIDMVLQTTSDKFSVPIEVRVDGIKVAELYKAVHEGEGSRQENLRQSITLLLKPDGKWTLKNNGGGPAEAGSVSVSYCTL